MSAPLIETMEGYYRAEKTITFAGGTTDAVGDDGGALDPYTLFTVTGVVAVKLVAKCTTLLASAGGGTVAIGTTITPTGLITTTTATDVDANELWHDASPDASVEATTVVAEKIVSEDIIMTTATADVTSGVIKVVALWRPLTSDGNVVTNTAN